MRQLRRWHIHPSVSDLEVCAADMIRDAAQHAIERAARFTLVLAGGSTPEGVYRRLREQPCDWLRWHLFFGDERCRPEGHAERNDRAAREAWLDHVPIPASQIHPMQGELGPEEAARRYARLVAAIDSFDLVLLGLGHDGHTASLFPGHDWPTATEEALPVLDSPKPPPERVSLSVGRLSRAERVMFLISGARKRDAIAAWRRGDAIPAAAITPKRGVDVLLDVEAWPDRFL